MSRQTKNISRSSFLELKIMPNVSKIKSILKKCQSFGKVRKSYIHLSSNGRDHISIYDSPENSILSLVHADISGGAPKGSKVEYVGKSRRRYYISAHYLSHPLLRALVKRCEVDNGGAFAVCCEVVLG